MHQGGGGGGLLGVLMALKQILASPSKVTWLHFSTFASWIAQSNASVSAWRGDVFFVNLAQILIGTPWWSRATTAIAAWELEMAASTLILMHPKGGGHQDCTRGGWWGMNGGAEIVVYSRHLEWTCLMEAEMSQWQLWWREKFLALQISSSVKAKSRGTWLFTAAQGSWA